MHLRRIITLGAAVALCAWPVMPCLATGPAVTPGAGPFLLLALDAPPAERYAPAAPADTTVPHAAPMPTALSAGLSLLGALAAARLIWPKRMP